MGIGGNHLWHNPTLHCATTRRVSRHSGDNSDSSIALIVLARLHGGFNKLCHVLYAEEQVQKAGTLKALGLGGSESKSSNCMFRLWGVQERQGREGEGNTTSVHVCVCVWRGAVRTVGTVGVPPTMWATASERSTACCVAGECVASLVVLVTQSISKNTGSDPVVGHRSAAVFH